MANRQCTFCGGDHTEVKCPQLEGRIQHLVNVINANKSNGNNWGAKLDTIFDLHHIDHIWRKFIDEADKSDLLGYPAYKWWNMARAYKKRLNYKRAGEKRRGQKRTKVVKCGYCHASGHTRRTCKTMKRNIEIFRADTTLRRAMFLDKCREIGLGRGALLSFTPNERYNSNYADEDGPFLTLVTEIPVHLINAINSSAETHWEVGFERAHIVSKIITNQNTRRNAALCLNKFIFNEAFEDITTEECVPFYNSIYDVEVASRSSDLSWDESRADEYLDLLKKKDHDTISCYVRRAKSWLEQNKI